MLTDGIFVIFEDFCVARYRHGKIFGTTLAGLKLDSWILIKCLPGIQISTADEDPWIGVKTFGLFTKSNCPTPAQLVWYQRFCHIYKCTVTRVQQWLECSSLNY